MSQVVAVIPARGGSKGIANKNTISIAGKPLLAWSIETAVASKAVDSVWVTSDSDEILDVAVNYGANAIVVVSLVHACMFVCVKNCVLESVF